MMEVDASQAETRYMSLINKGVRMRGSYVWLVGDVTVHGHSHIEDQALVFSLNIS